MRKIAFWLSIVFIFTIPWEGIRIADLGSMAKLVGLVAFAAWANAILFTGKVRPFHSSHLMIGLVLLWNVASLLWSMNLNETLERLQTYVQLILLVWLIWDLYVTPEQIRIGQQAYILGAYVSVWSTISNYLAGKAIGNSGRYTGLGFNANDLALILVLGLPIAWQLAVTASVDGSRKGRVLRFINFAYVPPALFAILLTASRTAVLSMLPAFWFILGSMVRLKPGPRILIAVALVGALIVLQPYVPQTSIDRLSTTSSELTEGDLNGRTQIWEHGMNFFQEHPILGAGSGAFKSINPDRRVAHNTYLSLLVETGIVGFFLFSTMVFLAVYQVKNQHRWMAAFWLVVFLSWAIGISSMSWETRKITWLIMAWVVASGQVLTQHKKNLTKLEVEPPLKVKDCVLSN